MPWAQAAGLWTQDTNGTSSLPGLFSAGDCCCSWMWAPSYRRRRGLSPSGVEAAGRAAAADYIRRSSRPALSARDWEAEVAHAALSAPEVRFDPRWVTQLLQNHMMPYYVLNIKEASRLEATLTMVGFLREHMVPPDAGGGSALSAGLHTRRKNMALNAEMILRAPLPPGEPRLALS